MRKHVIALAAMLFITASCDQSHLQQAQVQVSPGIWEPDRLLCGGELGEKQGDIAAASIQEAASEAPKDTVVEKRKRFIAAISAAFARRTNAERAKWLAEVCCDKTEGTKFTPLDLAEIALAETGGHKLSSRAVSSKGALGVWQLMPERARSHGYRPKEMRDDEKCADAAVRELSVKLSVAKGNLSRAKRLYCGSGPAARAYDKVRRKFRAEILRELEKVTPLQVASNR
jgi:hypothetical protein